MKKVEHAACQLVKLQTEWGRKTSQLNGCFVVLLCTFFSRLLTKENTAKFLIRQKETENLGAEHKNKKQQCYIIVRSKNALTLQSRDFVHGKELAFFFPSRFHWLWSLAAFRACRQSKTNHQSHESVASSASLFQHLDNFLIQLAPLTVDYSSRAS